MSKLSGDSLEFCKKPTSTGRAVVQRLQRLYYQYELVTTLSVLEPAEVIVFNVLLLLVLALICYYGYALAAYSLAAVVTKLSGEVYSGLQLLLPDWLRLLPSFHS